MTDQTNETRIETEPQASAPAGDRRALAAGLACLLAAVVHGAVMLYWKGLRPEVGGISALLTAVVALVGIGLLLRGLGRDATPLWRQVLPGVLLYLAYFVGITLFNATSPRLPMPVWLGISVVSTVGYVLVLVYSFRFITRLSLTPRLELALMLGSLITYLVVHRDSVAVFSAMLGHPEWMRVLLHAMPADRHYAGVLAPFLLILVGVFFGQLLARVVREPTILLPVSLVAALVDFWGVYWGPVKAFSEMAPIAGVDVVTSVASAPTAAVTNMPDAVQEQIRQLPPILSVFGGVAPPGSIGIGDFVFLAFYLTCAYRHGFSARRTMWGIFGGLLATSVVFATNGQRVFGVEVAIEYLPALPFICGGMLLANIPLWRLSRREWAMTAVPVVILLGLIGVSVVRTAAARTYEVALPVRAMATDPTEVVGRMARFVQKGVPDGKPEHRLPGHARVEVRAVQITYHLGADGPTPARLRIYLLGIGAAPGETWEYAVDGVPNQDPPSWLTRLKGNRPLREGDDLYGFDAVIAVDTLRAARAGVAVPEAAYALHGRIGALCRDIAPGAKEAPTRVALLLLGDGAVLTSDDLRFRKQFPDGRRIAYDAAAR